MRIGIVTPTLNAERYLAACLESIWRQHAPGVDIHHVVVDGESTDRTVEVASAFPSDVIVARDGGMYEAINRGMHVLDTDVFGYINADDELAPEALGRIAEVFRRSAEVSWLSGTIEFIDATGHPIARMAPVETTVRQLAGLGWCPIPSVTTWARMSFAREIGDFDTSFRNCADYDWYMRALRRRPLHVIPHVLGRFRLHGANLSTNLTRMAEESRSIQIRYGGNGALSYALGKWYSLRLNARNPGWLVAKKTGRIDWHPAASPTDQATSGTSDR